MTASHTPILLVRHGQTPWNVAGIWQGHADVPLTEEGQSQARAVAQALAAETERPWTRIVSSDLSRAHSTAEAIARALDLRIDVDPRLRERDVGVWSGSTRAEIEARDPETLAAWDAQDETVRLGGGESTVDVRARALDFLHALVERRASEPIIVVSHLGWIRTIAPEAPRENVGRTPIVAEDVLRRHATGGLVAASADDGRAL